MSESSHPVRPDRCLVYISRLVLVVQFFSVACNFVHTRGNDVGK